MEVSKADIIAALQQEIFLRQGFKPASADAAEKAGLDVIRNAFPQRCFPLSAIHEFHSSSIAAATASSGFITGILSSLLKTGGTACWITPHRLVFPPALASFGIKPENILFLEINNPKHQCWAMEECLKTEGLTAVVGEISLLDFTMSRRFQLAVEQTGVTGFLLRSNPKNLSTAAVSRWKISHLPTPADFYLPGLGHPRWKVELQKIRNGKPGSWEIEWRQDGFHLAGEKQWLSEERMRKVG